MEHIELYNEIVKKHPILERIGNTQLIDLSDMYNKSKVKLYAKAEFSNPAGSVKDRAALSMILNELKKNNNNNKRIILDATSGNTGIALAMIGSALKIKVKLIMPSNVTSERKSILNAYGAQVIYTNPIDGIDGAILKVKEVYNRDPEKYIYTDQYSNDANWQAHFHTTGQEIIKQTDGKITHFVAGVGTSGTLVGTGKRLKEYNNKIKIIEVQPNSPLHGLEGLKHMESSIIPKIYNKKMSDEQIFISTEESHQLVIKLARNYGIMVGPSSGAALAASLQVANKIEHGVIVTIFCDTGYRYLTERFWDERK